MDIIFWILFIWGFVGGLWFENRVDELNNKQFVASLVLCGPYVWGIAIFAIFVAIFKYFK